MRGKYYNREDYTKKGRLDISDPVKTKLTVRRFYDDDAFKRNESYSETVHWGNTGLNTGIQKLWDIAMTATAGIWGTGTTCYLGQGTASAASTATQTDLMTAATVNYASQDAGYPSRTLQTVTWQSTYAAAVANVAWMEFVVNNATAQAGGQCLVRVVSDQGIKVNGQTWQLQIAVTMS